MKSNLSKSILVAVICLFVVAGCKKEMAPTSVQSKVKSKNTITPYYFDWEQGDYVPAPSGVNILLPWASSANQSFPIQYATDIKKADGWEMVYNTFSPTQFNQPAYFVLYNRYRGLLRGYFYLTPGTSIPSSNISHSLVQRTNGTDAPILSYSGTVFANLSVPNNTVTLIQPYKTTATGTWYAEEFEMAYDPTVGTKPANANLMSWEINSINTSQIVMNGVSSGTIKGTLAQPVSAPNALNSAINAGTQILSIAGIGSLGLGTIFTSAATSAITAGLTGNIKNVGNAIFSNLSPPSGSNGGSGVQYANMITSTQYKLTGTATDIYQLASPSMTIPGSLNQNTVTGYQPLYTNPLGVMSLSAMPTAQLSYSLYRSDYPVNTSNWRLFLNTNSYQIIWNPAIINNATNGAQIQNLKQEILDFEPWDQWANNPNSFTGYYTPGLQSGPIEYIGEKACHISTIPYSGPSYFDNGVNYTPPSNFIPIVLWNDGSGDGDLPDLRPLSIETWTGFPDQVLSNQVLRISFDVVPNNGAPKSTIVKSFNIMLKGPFTTFP